LSLAGYLADPLQATSVKVTRIATGVAVGGDFECADEVTISRAIEGRPEILAAFPHRRVRHLPGDLPPKNSTSGRWSSLVM
jgi:hypothetical protein